jgi:hypothetical protein
MLLGFSTSNKLIEIQNEREVDVVMYAGDLCYAGLSGDLTPFNNVTEDDEFGHVSQSRFLLSDRFFRFGISGESKTNLLLPPDLS